MSLHTALRGLSSVLILLVALWSGSARAQVLVSAEAFFDDPSVPEGAGVALQLEGDGGISGGDALLALQRAGALLDGAGLVPGDHVLYLRFGDDAGHYSPPLALPVTVLPAAPEGASDLGNLIAGAEAFIDADPGEGAGLPLQVAGAVDGAVFEGLLEEAAGRLDAGDLPAGPHTVSVRTRDAFGAWSPVATQSFTVVEGEQPVIVGAEVFLDADPGVGMSVALPAAAGGALDEALEVAADLLSLLGVAPGPHTVGVRVQDSDGEWSTPVLQSFDLLDADGDGIDDRVDDDDDGDGIADRADNCPSVSNPMQADADEDGIGDACEDQDGDGASDTLDNCPVVPNPEQGDQDEDGLGDACDDDLDGDGLGNATEIAEGLDPGNPDSDGDGFSDGEEYGDGEVGVDSDGDGTIDALDDDSDGDGVPDRVDLCRSVGDVAQGDLDDDGVGDACDDDDDGDGVADGEDVCPLQADPDQEDLDEDGAGDACDDDIDGDELDNVLEETHGLDPEQADSDGDGVSDTEEYGDGDEPADTDGDDLIDALDEDSDDDGVLDGEDNCRIEPNPAQADTDSDGIGDACDGAGDRDGGGELDSEPDLDGGAEADLGGAEADLGGAEADLGGADDAALGWDAAGAGGGDDGCDCRSGPPGALPFLALLLLGLPRRRRP